MEEPVIDKKHIVFVGESKSRCGNCKSNLLSDSFVVQHCSSCGTALTHSVAEYLRGGHEKEDAETCTGLSCVGTGNISDETYSPY